MEHRLAITSITTATARAILAIAEFLSLSEECDDPSQGLATGTCRSSALAGGQCRQVRCARVAMTAFARSEPPTAGCRVFAPRPGEAAAGGVGGVVVVGAACRSRRLLGWWNGSGIQGVFVAGC